MKPINEISLKKIIWQNLNLEMFNDFCTGLRIDPDELEGKGIIEKTTSLINSMNNSGRMQELFDSLSVLLPDFTSEYFYDETIFIPSNHLPEIIDPTLIDVPPNQAGERVVKVEAKDPTANQLLKKINALRDRIEVLADPTSQQKLFSNLEEADQIIRGKYSETNFQRHMVRAESLIRTTSAEIYRLEKLKEIRKMQANSIIEAEGKRAKEEITISWLVPIILIMYSILVISVVIIAVQNGSQDYVVPILGIPLTILVWAAIGSLSAILYRYYKRDKRSALITELRIIIGRFWIGIVAGAIFYFAIRSGLYVLSDQNVDINTAPSGQLQLIIVLVWIVSFSDFIFEKIIARISGNIIGEETDKTVSSVLGVNISDISKTVERASSKQLNEMRRLMADIRADIEEIRMVKGNEELSPSDIATHGMEYPDNEAKDTIQLDIKGDIKDV